MHVLVVGASGLVGTNVAAAALEQGHDVTGTYYASDGSARYADRSLDKTDADAARALVREIEPDAVVDTAAFHDVDACERERDRAWTVNATGTRNVAAAASAVDAHVVYLSTDYVFPGDPTETPYGESDRVKPLNYYARTKYAGEQAARIADDWTVLRTSVVYGLASANFLTWVLSELRGGNEVGIVDDQTSTPTYARDLGRACVESAARGATGLYHATGPESLSRYEFTRRLADAYGFDVDLVEPITTGELGQEAARPADGSLDSSALYDALGFEFRSPREAFDAMRAD